MRTQEKRANHRLPPWEEQENKQRQVRRMEVYAAQIDRMDQGIGRILEALRQTGQWENTLLVFLADNGGCAEELGPRMDENVRQGRVPHASTKTSDARSIKPIEGVSMAPTFADAPATRQVLCDRLPGTSGLKVSLPRSSRRGTIRIVSCLLPAEPADSADLR